MIVVVQHETARSADYVCVNKVVITKHKVRDAVQGNGAGHGVGATIKIGLPPGAIFKCKVVASERYICGINEHSPTREHMHASVKSTRIEWHLAIRRDSK